MCRGMVFGEDDLLLVLKMLERRSRSSVVLMPLVVVCCIVRWCRVGMVLMVAKYVVR